MRSSMMGFEVQKRSLQMAQKSLDITAHNMGNMSKVGYTRQRVDTASLHISNFTYWQTNLSRLSIAGQGVTAQGVSQIRNSYLDKRYRDMAPYATEYDTKIKIMQELETTLDNIDNFGLLSAFNDLKSALQQVSLERADAKEMTSIVRNQVVNICSMLRSYSTDLNRLLDNNLVELEESISSANTLIDRIVMYNQAITGEYITDAARIISGQGVSKYGPLELLDERNLLLDELAQYGNIEVFQNANGSVRVTMAGVTIIDDQYSEKIVMRNYSDYNAAVLTFSNGEAFRPTAGEIKGYADMLNGNGPYAVGSYQNSEYGIPYYLHALDAFAEGFAALMNEVNKGDLTNVEQWERNLIWAGYEMNADGTYRLDDDGNYVRARVDASNIRVSDEWMDNVMMIGETFNFRSINYYALDREYSFGEVFLDPDTKNYYIVTSSGTYTSESIKADRDAGNIRRIEIYYDDAPNFSASKSDYATGDKFFDPNSGIYYEVKTDFTSTIDDIAAALASGDIEAIGVKQGEWQSANLDGGNLHRFVAAMEAERSWGRSLDFNGSVWGYLEFISNRLGQSIDHLEKNLDVTMDTINTLLDNRDAVSAVSDTEEGINMMTYQKWFNASARLMTTMDEALDTIINRMGRVGL